ncbi:MAG: haloacid dehalogenase type II [Gammaproteobacteria bacterium]|nr:haloacid dehalogenase type II [Gammaproteobacteria bacterium]
MQLRQFRALTFDCYGTLIDWETGIYEALRPWLDAQGLHLERDQVLEAFAQYETAQQTETPAMLYPQLLAEVHSRLATHWQLAADTQAAQRFGASVHHWPAFDDSAASLSYLKQHYDLIILSNVDRAGFAASNARLGVEFDAIYTAEDIGSYKPNPANFTFMLNTLAERGISKRDILHTAQSLHHDHVPATAAGLATCWIDRRHAQGSFGATARPLQDVETEFRFPSMAALVDAHRAEQN